MLEKIIEHKRILLEKKKSSVPLKRQRNFPFQSILQKIIENDFIIIAETKKASPSGGIFRKKYRPGRIAVSYEKAGASAISVLTEEKYFLGSIEHLSIVKNSVKIPVLAKDFFIDQYQIDEAWANGADCILLILKILSDDDFVFLFKTARSLNLELLVEVQNEKELSRFFKIIPETEGVILGINSRNLENLKINIDSTFNLLSLLKGVKIPVIAESGINDGKVLKKLYEAGANGALIGTHLLKAKSPENALRKFLKEMKNG